MTDDLNDLKQLMDAATPVPDAERKADNIALAQKNFAALQGSSHEPRPIPDRSETGLFAGVRQMLNSLTSRAALTASTAVVAVGVVVLTPLGGMLMPNLTDQFEPAVFLDEGQGQRLGKVAAPEPAVIQEAAPAPQTVQEAADLATTRVLQGRVEASSTMQATPRALDAPLPELRLADAPVMTQPDTETFANADTNPVQVTTEAPVSTFSIDVDTASYSVIRNSLTRGQLPPQDAVRVEEMINYFTYDYSAPQAGEAFAPSVTVMQTPWNADTQLLKIGIQGAEITERPPLNLVFLIDTSGSMQDQNKLPLLKQSFRLMLGQLRPEDQIAIVTYSVSAGQVLDPTPAGDRTAVLNALDNLEAGGSTAGQAGLQQAYATAATMAEDGEVSRVILATDGDFNVGLSDPNALEDYIARQRESGTYLSVLGFGRGNLDDATMQALAQNGNGQAAYIDTLSEAQRVLVDQLSGALFPIANDVKIQVEFNPAQISEYRLIGYETRALRREDFNNDKVDAGDIGAGHQVTALYEMTPVGSPAVLNDPLRFSTTARPSADSDEVAFLRLRYKAPGETSSRLIEVPITETNSAEPGFAAAIAGFGQLLRGGQYTADWTYSDAIRLANDTKGADPFGYRAEAVQLMRLAESLNAQ